MRKYVYLCFIKWTRETVSKGHEGLQVWFKKHAELCKENGVDIVCIGDVFGVVEDGVIGYGTDMHRDAFQEFRDKVWNLDSDFSMNYTKTFQVLSVQT